MLCLSLLCERVSLFFNYLCWLSYFPFLSRYVLGFYPFEEPECLNSDPPLNVRALDIQLPVDVHPRDDFLCCRELQHGLESQNVCAVSQWELTDDILNAHIRERLIFLRKYENIGVGASFSLVLIVLHEVFHYDWALGCCHI